MKTEAELKQEILEILKKHVGEKSAIDAGGIGKLVGVRENATHATTRGMITQIMREFDVPIGASGSGYFAIEDEEEYERYIGRLHNRMTGIEDRIANVKRAWNATHAAPIDDD